MISEKTTCFGPDETTRSTVDSRGATTPAVGVWRTTLTGATVQLSEK